MWFPGREFVRVDWKPGSLLVPPEGWYHHHFTTSKEPVRHLTLRRGLRHVGHPWRPNLSEHEGGHLLEHEDEPPEIRAMYEAELKKEDIPLRMRPVERRWQPPCQLI
jgi:gentisate 1,2-dioxygenase